MSFISIAQQIGEICRTASSSSLLIDSLTKKVSHQSETIEELRHEIQALKTHMVNMSRLDQAPLPPGLTKGQLNQQQSKEEAYKKHEIFGLIKEQVEQAFASKQGFLTEKVDMMEVSLNVREYSIVDCIRSSQRS
jgi:TolA-binding protein